MVGILVDVSEKTGVTGDVLFCDRNMIGISCSYMFIGFDNMTDEPTTGDLPVQLLRYTIEVVDGWKIQRSKDPSVENLEDWPNLLLPNLQRRIAIIWTVQSYCQVRVVNLSPKKSCHENINQR